MSLVYFAILIGGLIFVHELGHFLFAKFFDVKVLRFSIGFGPRLFSFEYGETEYTICALPLGGYVKMMGFDFDSLANIPEEEKDRALMAKPIWQRSLITFAGPAFNFIFPALIYFLFTLGQATVPPPTVGEVLSDTPAERAGLEAGDRIVKIEDQSVDYWHELTEIISSRYNEKLDIVVERNGEQKTIQLTPETKRSTDVLGLNPRKYGRIGIQLPSYGTTVAPKPKSPAARAGLQLFDKIVAVDGTFVERFDKLQSKIEKSRGDSVELTYLKRDPVDISYTQLFEQQTVTTTVEPTRASDGTWTIGLEPSEMFLSAIETDSPADKAGLQVGDQILEVDGARYNNFRALARHIRNDLNKFLHEKTKNGDADNLEPEPISIKYRRNGVKKSTSLTPLIHEYKGQGSQQQYRIEIGWKNLSDTVRPDDVPFPFGPRLGFAVDQSISKTAEIIEVMITGFVRMAQGRVSLDTVGGPIMIGELAAQAGEAGWGPFLQMMALISINLGVINLLPIPILDGGHLVLYAIEAVKREPLSYRTRQIAAYIGIVLLIFLMLLAFKNDIERNWEYIADAIRSL